MQYCVVQSILRFSKLKKSDLLLSNKTDSKNSKQSQGEPLEKFVISNLFKDNDYVVQKNTPIDYQAKDGTKIEIKKRESLKNVIPFNSSYPDKNILYILGYVKELKILQIFFIYGDFWFGDFNYQNLSEKIKNSVQQSVSDLNSNIKVDSRAKGSLTIKNIDNKGTKLRLRDFWDVKNPNTIYNAFSQKKLVVALKENRFNSWNKYHKEIKSSGIKVKKYDQGVLLWM